MTEKAPCRNLDIRKRAGMGNAHVIAHSFVFSPWRKASLNKGLFAQPLGRRGAANRSESRRCDKASHQTSNAARHGYSINGIY